MNKYKMQDDCPAFYILGRMQSAPTLFLSIYGRMQSAPTVFHFSFLAAFSTSLTDP